MAKVSVLLCILLVFDILIAVSGNYCYHQVITYHGTHVKSGWWGRKYVVRIRTATQKNCCSGYGGAYCNEPICNPPCQNGGTCILPDTCRCPSAHIGRICETDLCSQVKPCFPGICTYPGNCICQNGFTGKTCLKLQQSQAPEIMRSTAYLINKKRTSHQELYRFVADSTRPGSPSYVDKLWVSEKDYNIIIIYFEAIYRAPDLQNSGSYLEGYKMGIVDGRANLVLRKSQREGSSQQYQHQKNYTCPMNPSSQFPEENLFRCNITEQNFDFLLENGDVMTFTVTAKNGGYRSLYILGTKTHYSTEFYEWIYTEKKMQFMFDFDPPYHCLEHKTCQEGQEPLLLSDDISKGPIQISWDGWNDTLSGIGMYTIQVFPMHQDRTGDLTELNPANPIYFKSIDLNDTFPTYQPEATGMYSILLEAEDKANNTKYSRRLLLFDNESTVTTTELPMTIDGSVEVTGNVWIDNNQNEYYTNGKPITVQWKGHFQNKKHIEMHLLNQVAPFKPSLIDNFRHRNVSTLLDDHEGKRSIKQVTNKNGIAMVQVASKRDHQGGKSIKQIPTDRWINVTDYENEEAILNISRLDGDSIRIWVKASDVLGNSAIDSVLLSVDSTPPVIEKPSFVQNVKNGTFPFSSLMTFTAFDKESGIEMYKWRIVTNDTEKVLKTGEAKGNRTEEKPSVQIGRCSPAGGCYNYLNWIEMNNCWFVVSKDKLSTQIMNVEIDVYNLAMLNTTISIQIDNLPSLDGMEEYSGPSDLEITATTDTSVTFKWHQGPSCYIRTNIVLQYNVSGQTMTTDIHKDSEYYTLGNLEPETAYTVQFIVQYGEESSDPVQLTFTTGEAESLSTGIIAAIAAVSIVLLGFLIAGVILWRTGKLNRYKESIYGHISRRTIKRRQNTYRYAPKEKEEYKKSYLNNAYRDSVDGEDDVYMYGQMVFDTNQIWEIPHSQVSLVEKIGDGRFADIYKATQKCERKKKKTIIAKVLKESHVAFDEFVMNAKINFFATKVGSHPNIVHFIGAVMDSKALGPFILLELCEGGVMKNWLQKQRAKMNDSAIDTLYRLTHDVAKGMDYLASKEIVHKHLAARNILLTSVLEAKVAGFGPSKETEQQDGDTLKEKVPIKWVAPECMTTVKDATTRSDVWSYGIVLWEIFSLGETPYPGMRSMEVASKVTNGYRMERPEYCGDMYFQLMKKCWQKKPLSRPTFSAIVQEIDSTFSTGQDDYYYTNN